ncbi:MAG TPA: hypothetical protein VHL80_06225 [Polyangia bacterium]|nr:hypothetical protein [Polyangia bacterium]
MPGRRRLARGLLWIALATPALEGCFDDPTEVVVVIDTDAKLGRDYQNVAICFSTGAESDATGTTWPVTVGVRKMGTTPTFTVLVSLSTTSSPGGCNSNLRPPGTFGTAPAFDTRSAKDVEFVDGEMRSLFLPLFKACACVDANGMPTTNCQHALDPDCQDLSNPKLGDFDEDNLPHLPASAKAD